MPEEKKMSSQRESIQFAFALAFSIGLWFLLIPETFWERVSAVLFCSILLVLVSMFPYLHNKVK